MTEIAVTREGSKWKLPDKAGGEFVFCRSRLVAHLRFRLKRGDFGFNTICGAVPNYSFGSPTTLHWGSLCPKCRKVAAKHGFEIPNLSPIKQRK